MKIALVVHDFDPGFGQGRYTVELARRLAAHHQVHVYANRFAVPLAPNWAFQPVRAWRATALTTVLTFLAQAERLLRRRHYDLIHAQGLTCWGADVITAHICNAARARQARSHRVRDRLFLSVIVPLERRFFRQPRARHLIAVSRKVAGELAAAYGWRRPSSVIYHGIDSDGFRPAADAQSRQRARRDYGWADGAWAWLFVGEAAKGLREVIAQLPRFRRASLLVISRSDLAWFRRLAQGLGVEGRVRFQGPTNDLARVYQAAEVLVYPSAYDAFGLVVAEAMASGLPVLVGKNVGAAEWIEPEVNGLLCDPRDPASLQRQLEWLETDPRRGRQLGQAARATVLAHTWDACAAATEAVYAQMSAAGSA
ncbi:MAG: glycosyltransferase family 4 protein [Verrucomicrobia bacterium]|nr:glycosyltransferase family 4 protein [Verrucomicrobiota bacterium]